MAKIPRSGVDVSVEYGKVAGLYRTGGKAFAERAVRPATESAETTKKALGELLSGVTGEPPETAKIDALLSMGRAVMRAVRDVRTASGRHRTSGVRVDGGGLQLHHTVALLKCLRSCVAGMAAMNELGPEASPELAFAEMAGIVVGKVGQEVAALDAYEAGNLRSDVLVRFIAALTAVPGEAPPEPRSRRPRPESVGACLTTELQARNIAAMLGAAPPDDALRLTDRQYLDDVTWRRAAEAEDVIQDAAPLLGAVIEAMRTSNPGNLQARLFAGDWPGGRIDGLHERMETLSNAVDLALTTLNVEGGQGNFLGLLPSPTRMLAWGCVEALAGIGLPPEPEGASKRRVSRKNPKPYVYGYLVGKLSGIFGSIVAHESEAEPVDVAVRSDEAQAASREYASGRVLPGGLAAAFGYRWRPPGVEAPASAVSPARQPVWAQLWAGKDWGGKR